MKSLTQHIDESFEQVNEVIKLSRHLEKYSFLYYEATDRVIKELKIKLHQSQYSTLIQKLYSDKYLIGKSEFMKDAIEEVTQAISKKLSELKNDKSLFIKYALSR